MIDFDLDWKELKECFNIKTLDHYKDYTFLRYPKEMNRSIKQEHRAKMEAYLGRELERNEFIHHKNLDKRDNNIENLWVCNNREHGIAQQSLRSIGEALALILYEKGLIYFDDDKGIYRIINKKSIHKNLKNNEEIAKKIMDF